MLGTATSRRVRTTAITALLCALLLGIAPGAAVAQPPFGECFEGDQVMGARYRICMPPVEAWNGDLVVYAHGYVTANVPVPWIPEDQLILPDGTSIPDTITGLGYGFAMSSYRVNGLAIVEGQEDLIDLVDVFKDLYGEPGRVYLIGPSEGGLVTTLCMEKHPDVFDGGVAICGPIGSFRHHINYLGDVRVLLDYFFPGLLPGTAVEIPTELIEGWETSYRGLVGAALVADPHATEQLIRVANVPIDPDDPSSAVTAVLDALNYNVMGMMDAREKLGGQPFDNITRWYRGSDNDWRLNSRRRGVQRYAADQAALERIASHYETSGALGGPLVTVHNLGDPEVPYWHEPLYRFKVFRQGAASLHTNMPSLRYGHCNIGKAQALAAFGLMVWQVDGKGPGLLHDAPDESPPRSRARATLRTTATYPEQ